MRMVMLAGLAMSITVNTNAALACNTAELPINMRWSYEKNEDGFRDTANDVINKLGGAQDNMHLNRLISAYKTSQDHNPNNTAAHIDGCGTLYLINLIRSIAGR